MNEIADVIHVRDRDALLPVMGFDCGHGRYRDLVLVFQPCASVSPVYVLPFLTFVAFSPPFHVDELPL